MLRKWSSHSLVPSAQGESKGAPGQRGKKGGTEAQLRGSGPPPLRQGRGSGSLWEHKRQGAGQGDLSPVCAPSCTELTGPPQAETHQHPNPSHPTYCQPWTSTSGIQQGAMNLGVLASLLSAIATPSLTPGTQEGLQEFPTPRLAKVTRRQNSNRDKVYPSICPSLPPSLPL